MVSHNSSNSTFSDNEFERQSQHVQDITNDRREYEMHEEIEQQEQEVRQYRKNEHIGDPMNRKSAESKHATAAPATAARARVKSAPAIPATDRTTTAAVRGRTTTTSLK